MKCISLMQPWASLVITGAKQYETRGWLTRYRGPLLIHASKRFPPYCRLLCVQEPFRSALETAGYVDAEGSWSAPLGVLLGGVLLEDCQRTDELILSDALTDKERQFGDYSSGRYAWRLSNPHPLVVPVPFSGQLGIFDVSDALLDGNFLLHWAQLVQAQGEVAHVH